MNTYDVIMTPSDDGSWVLKSEAVKELRHNKYKRCLAMANGCEYLCAHYQFREVYGKRDFFRKWMFRWLELAEKFKPNKEAK